jgi:pimeloyl-ACP methyl ester carboxylesterase
MRYCTRWRLRKAAELLVEGARSAAEIAFLVGFGSEASFNRAFRREYGQPPVTWRRQYSRDAAADRELPEQQVRYCATADGTRLAWSAVGSGMPLVKTANWLNHIDYDWHSPVWRHWLTELTRENCLIRYDERGNGLSDWDSPNLSFEAFVDDLETVVDAAGVNQFDLLGISQGAPVAIAYSLRHPGRIRRMVLLGGYARGWALRLKGDDLARREAMVTLTRTGWGSDNPAYRQMFTGLYIPGGTPEQLGWWNELQKISASPANAERLQRALSTIDVSALLARVTVPTLVAHATHDHVIPCEAGRELAGAIPGAKFVELDSENHVLLEHEPAWPVLLGEIRRFLRG